MHNVHHLVQLIDIIKRYLNTIRPINVKSWIMVLVMIYSAVSLIGSGSMDMSST